MHILLVKRYQRIKRMPDQEKYFLALKRPNNVFVAEFGRRLRCPFQGRMREVPGTLSPHCFSEPLEISRLEQRKVRQIRQSLHIATKR